jgi:hypothetical protein
LNWQTAKQGETRYETSVHIVNFERILRGVRIDSFWVPNGDGLHFGGCRDVVVSDCVVKSRDDAFIVRTHQEQMKRPRPCERMVVNNCVLHSAAASAIRFGWTGDGPIRDVSFSNIVSPQARYGVSFFLPAEPPPGKDCMDPPRGRGLVPPPVSERLPFAVENVRFSNMPVTGDGYPIYVAIGADARLAGIKNVSFSDCRFRTELPAHVDCRPRHNVRGWSFNGTTFEVKGRKTGIGKAIGKGIQP